jgi:hypothetical protein
MKPKSPIRLTTNASSVQLAGSLYQDDQVRAEPDALSQAGHHVVREDGTNIAAMKRFRYAKNLA